MRRTYSIKEFEGYESCMWNMSKFSTKASNYNSKSIHLTVFREGQRGFKYDVEHWNRFDEYTPLKDGENIYIVSYFNNQNKEDSELKYFFDEEHAKHYLKELSNKFNCNIDLELNHSANFSKGLYNLVDKQEIYTVRFGKAVV